MSQETKSPDNSDGSTQDPQPKPLAVVVDDEVDFGELVARWLERAGFRVVQCNSGWAGLDAVRAEETQLVVSDIVMPGGLDGWDLAELIYQADPRSQVVLMTGFSKKLLDQGRQLPANVIGVLEKPFREADLLAALRRH